MPNKPSAEQRAQIDAALAALRVEAAQHLLHSVGAGADEEAAQALVKAYADGASALGQQPGSWAFAARGDGSDTLEIDIYDMIAPYWGYVNAVDIRALLKQNPQATRIFVRINSEGGDVFEGTAIRNLLAEHPAEVVVQIDGLAASMATGVAMAGDKVLIREGAWFMIHNAWGCVCGEAAYLRKWADVLDKMCADMAAAYAAHSGQTVERCQDLMNAETWMTASEAVDLGFCDELLPLSAGGQAAAAATAQAFASVRKPRAEYRNVPADVLARVAPNQPITGAAPAPAAVQATPPPAEPVQQKETEMTLKASMIKALGLKEDATDEAIEAACSARLAQPVAASEAVMQALGARTEQAALARATELAALAASILAQTESSTLAQAQGVLAGWRNSAAQVVTLAAQVSTLEKEKGDAKRDGVIATLTAAGKLPPALQPWAKTQTADQLEVFAAALPEAPFTKTVKEKDGDDDENAVALTETERAVAKAMGKTAAEALEAKKREIKARKQAAA